jgi:beta-galactosidase
MKSLIPIKLTIMLSALSLALVFSTSKAQFLKVQYIEIRSSKLFDFDWRFHRGGAMGAEQPGFDDASWRKIDLPHDWSIEDLPGTQSPFQPDAIGQVSSGFSTGGTGWYRKTFAVSEKNKGRHAYIQFDGIYMNADIWLNGQLLGNHPYGYTSFWYDITGFLNFGEENVMAVQVKNEGQTSRWYSGSGIYRHVWMSFVDPVHIAPWGTYITTPEVTTTAANVIIRTNINNTSDKAVVVELITRFKDPWGIVQAESKSQETVPAGKYFEFSQNAGIKTPDLWSTDSPRLYSAISYVYYNGSLADSLETKFGIRSINFSTDKGFQLNGKALELKGGCVHHDNGPLGSRAYDRAEERRVELLKASGFNAIRCAHNPPSPAFLEACDRLGMLVIDEAFDMWKLANNPHDYHLYFNDWWKKDIESMVYRDRNHPCIIMWSIGNEIGGMETPEIVEIAHKLRDYVHNLEPARPVTAAVNAVSEKKDPFFGALDVAGYNYAKDQYVKDHERKPDRIMFCTESFPLEDFEYWSDAVKYPWVLGDFVWTSFDYIGEASIGWRGYMQKQDFYPWTLAFCGDIDICGWKRPQSFYRDVLWQNGSRVSIFVKPPQPSFPVNPKREYWSLWHWNDVVADWNWNGYENQRMEVHVYSSCERVELFLNGKSLGIKETNSLNRFTGIWQVPYVAGVLKAVGLNKNRKATETVLETTGKPVAIKLFADRQQIKANGQDLSYITVELEDEKGLRDPKAENQVDFEISGPGTLEAVGNANPMSTESYQLPGRKAWKGRCLVIVKSGKEKGDILLSASSAGLKNAKIIIRSGE